MGIEMERKITRCVKLLYTFKIAHIIVANIKSEPQK